MYFTLFSIGLGSVLGAWLRWFIGLKLNTLSPNLPYGTLLANLIGAFLIGFFASWFANSHIPPMYKLFLITGFCGALTTFSTFSIEVVMLLQAGRFEYAIFNIICNVLGSLIFTGLGIVAYKVIMGH